MIDGQLTLLECLKLARVERWERYHDAMRTVNNLSDEQEVLEALEYFGVEEWSGYPRAMDIFSGMEWIR